MKSTQGYLPVLISCTAIPEVFINFDVCNKAVEEIVAAACSCSYIALSRMSVFCLVLLIVDVQTVSLMAQYKVPCKFSSSSLSLSSSPWKNR